MLKFQNPRWRFKAPAGRVPSGAVEECFTLVSRIAAQAENQQDVYETFKSFFAAAVGQPQVYSSSGSWAQNDLQGLMSDAAENPPMFIEAFLDACQAIERKHRDWGVPGADDLNAINTEHHIPYVVDAGQLLSMGTTTPLIQVQAEETILEEARREFMESLERSTTLLEEGRGREAVQNLLWLLESVTTAFRDFPISGSRIKGHYFNKIIPELRRAHSGTVLDRALEWLQGMHGYLSSPTGGGVRHGLNLDSDPISENEARLFCNLIRSYLDYLLREYARLEGN